MLFNSVALLFFLPIVFLLYWFVFKQRRLQNALIVAASYVFYGWWDWRFLFLIAFTSACSFACGILIEFFDNNRKWQKTISVANIVLNLGILGVFKYYNFFVENLDILCSKVGFHIDWITVNVILPVGVSFYTFQALSYTIDVYHRKQQATHDLIDFFAYISFFPQLVAGPIERATNLLPQFQNQRIFVCDNAIDGCRQMLWGFFKKMVVADNCAIAVNLIFSSGGGGFETTSGFAFIVGGILFTFQIYCDFSGYSDIAIGCARIFGFELMRNFNYPYFSRSIPEFWRRWHISLTTWFRDYIYFPLGGSYCDRWKIMRNVYVVWVLSGLWHGANWTFVCWGLYHGTLLVIYNIIEANTKFVNKIECGRFASSIYELSQILMTFFLVVLGWIIFRAESIADAYHILATIFNPEKFNLDEGFEFIEGLKMNITIPSILLLIGCEWIQRSKQHVLQFSASGVLGRNESLRVTIYLALMMIILCVSGTQSEFIYFQF